jgi:hypothetical protein
MADGPVTPHLDDQNPWPGLEQYTESAKNYFKGRDQDSAEMLRLIRLSPFVALYGKSGLGKSSMLQAGVFPTLRAERFLPVYLRLDYTEANDLPPLQQALARLMQETAGTDATPPEPGESLWAYLQRRERPIWTHDNFPLTPVLVFDQFEEVFSHGGSPAHVKQVLDSIADLIGNRLTSELAEDPDTARRLNLQTQQYRVVLSFRSDFLAEVEGWERNANLPKHEALHLKAMSRATAIDAVQSAGKEVLEPGVAEQIVDFVLDRDETGSRTTEVEPVLLSLCCYQLNNRRRPPARIDSALLASVGKDILLDFYHEALQGMEPRVSVFIEDNLIQGGRYRSSFPRDEAIVSNALTGDELESLMMRRLLRVDPQGDVPRIELIHDRLVGIVRDAKEARRGREREEQAKLQEAQRLQRERDSERLAQAEQERRRVKRQRLGLAVVALLLLGLSIGLWSQTRRANEEAELAKTRLVLAQQNAEVAANETRRANEETKLAETRLELAQQNAALLADALACNCNTNLQSRRTK